jgi:hypothetical protein
MAPMWLVLTRAHAQADVPSPTFPTLADAVSVGEAWIHVLPGTHDLPAVPYALRLDCDAGTNLQVAGSSGADLDGGLTATGCRFFRVDDGGRLLTVRADTTLTTCVLEGGHDGDGGAIHVFGVALTLDHTSVSTLPRRQPGRRRVLRRRHGDAHRGDLHRHHRERGRRGVRRRLPRRGDGGHLRPV